MGGSGQWSIRDLLRDLRSSPPRSPTVSQICPKIPVVLVKAFCEGPLKDKVEIFSSWLASWTWASQQPSLSCIWYLLAGGVYLTENPMESYVGLSPLHPFLHWSKPLVQLCRFQRALRETPARRDFSLEQNITAITWKLWEMVQTPSPACYNSVRKGWGRSCDCNLLCGGGLICFVYWVLEYRQTH